MWQINQVIYFDCYREMKFLNTSFVGVWDQSASHMPISNRCCVQNQRPMVKLKFFVKEVYTSGLLALEIMSKKSAVKQDRRSLCKSQEKKILFSHKWESRCSASLSGYMEVAGSRKFIKAVTKCVQAFWRKAERSSFWKNIFFYQKTEARPWFINTWLLVAHTNTSP